MVLFPTCKYCQKQRYLTRHPNKYLQKITSSRIKSLWSSTQQSTETSYISCSKLVIFYLCSLRSFCFYPCLRCKIDIDKIRMILVCLKIPLRLSAAVAILYTVHQNEVVQPLLQHTSNKLANHTTLAAQNYPQNSTYIMMLSRMNRFLKLGWAA